MPRRHEPEVLSPRALARLRASPRAYVPTELDLARSPGGGRGPGTGNGPALRGAPSRRDAVAAPERAVAGAGWGLSRTGPVVDGFCRGVADHGGRHSRAVPPHGWLRSPAAFVGARWRPGRAAVLGVVVLAVLAVAVFGLRVAWARSAGEGTVIAPGGGSRAGPTGLSAGAAPVGVAPGGTPGTATGTVSPGPGVGGVPGAVGAGAATAPVVVVVHVVGEVRRPGLQRLPVGARVSDAVDAAGGPAKEADLSRVNLARVLVDGEQVRVPAPGDPVEPGPVTGTGAAGGAGSGTGSGGAEGLVPLNTADLDRLDTLPGVGPVLAQRIVDWRTSHGRFTSVDELGR